MCSEYTSTNLTLGFLSITMNILNLWLNGPNPCFIVLQTHANLEQCKINH